MSSVPNVSTTRREYRLTGAQRYPYIGLGAVFSVGAGFFFKQAIDPIGRELALPFAFLFLIPGLMLVLAALRARLTLDGDQLELRSALRTHIANRNEIEGLRTVKNQYGKWTRICLKEERGAFNVSDSFTGSDDLNEWLKGLPDLDERDAADIRRQIGTQNGPGATEDEQLDVLKRAKAWSIGFSIAAGVASVLGLFNYTLLHNCSIVFLALFPPLGFLLIHRFPLLFTFFKSKTDPRADIGFVVLWPGFGMIMSYQFGTNPAHLVDYFSLIYWALLALFCYLAAFSRIAWANSVRWGSLAGLLIFGAVYSIGLVNAVNTVPDRSSPSLYRSEILKMYETHGKGASSYLRLAPWGPLAYWDDVDVPRRMYRELNVGDQVCIGLHRGFLRAPWFTVSPCAEQPSAPVPQV